MNLNNISALKSNYLNNTSNVNMYKDNQIHNIKSGSKLSEEKTDVVSISSNAEAYREIKTQTAEISEQVKSVTTADKIQELKTKVQDGTYAVSTGVTADAILAHMLF